MFKLLISALLLLSAATSAQSISPDEAKVLVNKLPNAKPDTGQINILLKLAKYQVFKPGENKSDLDSAANFIRKAEEINANINSKWASGYILLVKSYLLRENGERERAKEVIRWAIDTLRNKADKSLLGEAYFDYSSYFGYNDAQELNERINLVSNAVSCFEQSGNAEQLGASLQMLGDLDQINGSAYTALQKLQLALNAYASIHHDAVQGIYSLMGKIYTRLRDYKSALNYELLALRTAEKVRDNSIQMCMINTDIGQTLSQLNEKQKAISYLNKAIQIAEKYHDPKAVYFSTTELANILNGFNKPLAALKSLNDLEKKYERPVDLGIEYNIARAYIGSYCILKEYDKAQPYCDMLLRIAKAPGMDDHSIMLTYAEMVKFYISSGQFKLAAEYLHKHRALTEKISDLLQMGNSYRLWSMLDTAQHNYRSAVDHLITYKNLNDSLFNETKSHQLEELQVAYETDKKEKDIQVKNQSIQLLTKQDELQKTKLQQSSILRNISFGVLGLLIIIIALLYNRYRLKQRTNKKLESQQAEIEKQNVSLHRLVNEKDWLVKEIHHRVKNNLQIVMSLLNSQSAYINNDAALTAIHDSQHRVHAMSLIHQKLYNTENVSTIDLSTYIRELVSYLADSFNTGQRIRFEFAIDPLEMDVSQAVPLGLILNEAITNSIKYAFPDDRNGVISISLSNMSPDHYLLIVSDNGIGIPPNFTGKKVGSLGMTLIEGLSEDIDGNFSIENSNGTKIKISFAHDQGVKRPDTLATSFVSHNED